MSTSNLHSLLNKPWYIEQNYANAHLPLLFNILDGKAIPSVKTEEKSIIELKGYKNSSSSVDQQIVVLSIKDPILKYNQECGPRGTKDMMKELDYYRNDNTVAGIVLDIDSGGGQSYGTPEFYDYLKAYPKPVVSYTDGYMCSAAYYIGSAAAYIVANKRAEALGSIGAYSQILDLTGYYAKKGAVIHTIYATKSTDKNKGYREVLEGKYDTYIKEELDPLVNDFHEDMLSVRPQLKDKVLKGGTFNASKSLKLGLIDEIGTMQTAIDKVFALANVDTSKNTNPKKTKMNLKNIEAVIGAEFEVSETKDGVILNETQALAVDAKLASLTEDLGKANADATAAENDIVALNTVNTDVIAGVNESLELEGDAKVTDVQGAITALQSKITELGEQPGDTHSNVNNNGEDDQAMPDYVDAESSIYKVK